MSVDSIVWVIHIKPIAADPDLNVSFWSSDHANQHDFGVVGHRGKWDSTTMMPDHFADSPASSHSETELVANCRTAAIKSHSLAGRIQAVTTQAAYE